MQVKDIASTLQRDLAQSRVRDIMTAHPICGSPDATLKDLATKMAEFNCGEIPICEMGKLVGVVTDRDITCRAVAAGRDPSLTRASEIMTLAPAAIRPDSKIDASIALMERFQVRRLPVVDENGHIEGILSMTDIARHLPQRKSGELLREVSRHRPGERVRPGVRV
ncbi:MAG TPA: CBS domain-containing protein [Thermoanaerobaculia bacterium]|nr:CBS domain-containing protein [Thermoanaerobaculia bacterium]